MCSQGGSSKMLAAAGEDEASEVVPESLTSHSVRCNSGQLRLWKTVFNPRGM